MLDMREVSLECVDDGVESCQVFEGTLVISAVKVVLKDHVVDVGLLPVLQSHTLQNLYLGAFNVHLDGCDVWVL